MTPDDPSLTHRARDAFDSAMPEHVAKLREVYADSGRAKLIAVTERLVLESELRDLEADESVDAGRVLVSLRRRREIVSRLAEVRERIEREGEREETAVVVAEVAKASGIFPAPEPLTPKNTLAAIVSGGMADAFTDEDRARMRGRRRR